MIRWRTRSPKIALHVLQLVLVGTPIALGGVHSTTLAAVSVLLVIALFITGSQWQHVRIRATWPPFLWVLAAASVLTTLYLLPVSPFWVELLSPNSTFIWEQARQLTASTHGTVRLGHHLSQNIVELCRILVLMAAFLLVYGLTRKDTKNGEVVLHTVVVTAALMVAIGIAQTITQTGMLFGMYTPTSPFAERGFYATFVNENHLAGFLNLGAMIALGQAFFANSQQHRVFFALCYVACTTGVVLSLSRGGMIAALAGIIVFGILSARNRTNSGRKSHIGALFLLLVLIFTSVIAAVGYDHIVREWTTFPGVDPAHEDIKFRALSNTFTMLSDYWRIGVGPGSYAHVFSSYNTASVSYTFTHPENFLLQWASDYGWIMAALLLVAGCAAVLKPLVSATDTSAGAGVICGLFTLTLHNLVDFSFSIPGVALPAITVLAVLIADSDTARARPMPQRAGALMVAVLILLVAPLMLWAESRFGDSAVDTTLQTRVETARLNTTTQPQPLSPDEVNLWWARPADPHLYYLEAVAAFQGGNTLRAEQWVGAALHRAPFLKLPRVLSARIALSNQKKDVAITTLRELLNDDWSTLASLVDSIVVFFPEPDDSLAVLPQYDEKVASAAVQIYVLGYKKLALLWLMQATTHHNDWYHCHLQYGLWLAENPATQSLANTQATQLIGYFPEKPGGYLVQASIEERAGRLVQALVLYRECQRWDPELVDALLGEARTLVAQGDVQSARLVLGRARSLIHDRKEQLGTLYEVMSRASERDGRFGAAATEMSIAVQMRPRDAAMWRRLAAVRQRAGENTSAEAALRQALTLEAIAR